MRRKTQYLLLSGALMVIISTVPFINQLSNNEFPRQVIAAQEQVQENDDRGELHGLLEVFSFKESIKQADLVAKIKIGDVVKEINEPTPKILFQATILNTLKEDSKLNSKNIQIMQQGNSEWSFNGNPLFRNGEEIILVLKKAEGYNNTYWILGEETNFYKVIDNDLIVKPSYYYSELMDIEPKSNIPHEKNNKGVQILKEKDLIERIKKLAVEAK